MVEPNIPLNERIELINRNDPSITKFELEYNEGDTATKDQMVSLFHALRQNTHVQKLDLYSTPDELRRTIFQQLLPPLLEENSSIQYLGFPKDMTNAKFLPSVDALCNNNNNATTNTLDLDDCDIRSSEGGEIIARLILTNNRITTINLWGNTCLGSAGASQIATALVHDNGALKTLDLGQCGIGDEGVDALCTALHVNNSSLETFRFYRNQITDEGYRTLARSLLRMSGLKEVEFDISPAVVQEIMEALLNNHSLQVIIRRRFIDARSLSDKQDRKWKTCCEFVCARNKMRGYLDEVGSQTRVAAREGVGPVPIPIGPLLRWCRRQGNSEVQVSLIHPLLRSRVNEIAKFSEAQLKLRHSKRRHRNVDYLQM